MGRIRHLEQHVVAAPSRITADDNSLCTILMPDGGTKCDAVLCFLPPVVPNSTKVADEEKKFRDCADLYQAGIHKNGVYTIQINPQETRKVQGSQPAVSPLERIGGVKWTKQNIDFFHAGAAELTCPPTPAGPPTGGRRV